MMDKNITVTNVKFIWSGKKYYEFSGPSTAEKPTEGVATGSLFHEVDTTKVYAYDESTETWYEQTTLGGDA